MTDLRNRFGRSPSRRPVGAVQRADGPGRPPAAEHSAHRLYAHVVWGTLHRLPLVTRNRVSVIEGQLIALCRRLDVRPVAVAVGRDRVHLLIRHKPTQCLAEITRWIKEGSTEALLARGAPVRWERGYAAVTVGPEEVRGLMRRLASRSARFAEASRSG